MNPADLDKVCDAIRESVTEGVTAYLVATHVTGRAGEFHLTIGNHQYLVTIEPIEDES